MRPRLIFSGLCATVLGGTGGVYAYAAALGNAYAGFGGQGGPSNDGLGIIIILCLTLVAVGALLFLCGLFLAAPRQGRER